MRRGITLIELTIIITVLIMFLSFLFPAAGAWKRGSDRSQCILNIRHVQLGVRSFSNMAGLDHGADVSLESPPLVLKNEVIGDAKFVETIPICPSHGTYSYGGNVIPARGELYMECSLTESARHIPKEYASW